MERSRYTGIVRGRLNEKRRLIQVIAGPRQVGKSTIIKDVLSSTNIPYVSMSADDIPVSGEDVSLSYWWEKQDEVDFVLCNGHSAAAFEVKSGGRMYGKGMDVFLKRYPESRVFTVSTRKDPDSVTIPLEEFLLENPLAYLD